MDVHGPYYVHVIKRLNVLAPVLLAGCYSYAPVQPAQVEPGMGVRARVTAAAAEQIAPLLGQSDARVVSGKLIENNAGAMVIEVPTTAPASVGPSAQTLNQRISIAAGQLVEIETRKLDRKRTGILVGAGVVTAGAVAIAALKGGPGLDRPPGGSSTDARIPLLRLHF